MGSLHAADQYWADNGHPQVCPAAWSVADVSGKGVAEDGIGWCNLTYDTAFVRRVASIPRINDRLIARRNLETVCIVSAHERGHEHQPYGYPGIDGNGHERSGIMRAELPEDTKAPAECVEWAMSLTKNARKK